MSTMFDQALGAQKEEEIARLKAEIERLQASQASGEAHPGFTYVSVDEVVALRLPENLKQPRRYFDPVKIAKLKDSIAKHGGVLEPILVRRAADGHYETISGERRWRCCVDLSIATIPAMVADMDDQTALEVALIAHLLSEDISAIEETDSIMGLLSLRLQLSFEDVKQFLIAAKNAQSRGDYTDESEDSLSRIAIAEAILEEFDLKLGSFVSNRLPLLNLAPPILAAVRAGQLSPTNATLINRAPVDFHDHLIHTSQGMTKAEVQATLTQLKMAPPSAHSSGSPALDSFPSRPFDNSGIINSQPPQEGIYSRIKAIRRRKKLLSDQRVQKQLRKAEAALKEIDAIAGELGVRL
jgi:ParB family chromosome partitioning protein